MVQWQEALFGMIHDLGSSPRSYKFPYHFSKAIPMRFSNVGIPRILNDQTYTRPKRSNQRHRFKGHAAPGQAHHIGSRKVNKFPAYWA